MSPTERNDAIKDAIRPYAMVANFSVSDVMSAALKVLPDVQPEEVADAFEAIGAEAQRDADAARTEIERRRPR